jgi:NADH kinase
LLALGWSSPIRNILLVRKENDSTVDEALIEYANHIHSTYPNVAIIFEPQAARQLHGSFPFPVYTSNHRGSIHYHSKVDLTTTLGGDGTILRASSLFATAKSVPPILSFSMGTLGFLGEWKVHEYKRAFREVYMSGAPHNNLNPKTFSSSSSSSTSSSPSSGVVDDAPGWDDLRGKSLGASRPARILLRNRLRVGLFDTDGTTRLPHEPPFAHSSDDPARGEDVFALNEVLLHRGASPHLAHITIKLGLPGSQRTLTTAIADGVLVSTPTGSTAYSLSSGGAIVHPLVSSILLTPICPRSLSFRPLVLPAHGAVTLYIEAASRGEELEVSVDGVRRRERLRAGMEVRVVGEEVRSEGPPGARDWARGGVPIVVRSGGGGGAAEGEDHWVGGLNSLLKFNYPFGEE